MNNDSGAAKEYHYKGKRLLSNTLPKPVGCYENVFLCAYTVNSEGRYPFQQFLLINEEEKCGNPLVFPAIDIFKD